MPDRFERLFEAWRLSEDAHTFSPGASEQTIAEFERLAGWRLPDEWRRLYAFSNGMHLMHDNLFFYPLLGDEGAALHQSEYQRMQNDKAIPREYWILCDDEGGEQFGLWVPAPDEVHTPVVQMGEYDPTFLSIAALTLTGFLLHRTAFYLRDKDRSAAWDAIALPEEFRSGDRSDAEWKRIKDWAEPESADIEDDPYKICLDPESLIEQLASL